MLSLRSVGRAIAACVEVSICSFVKIWIQGNLAIVGTPFQDSPPCLRIQRLRARPDHRIL